MVKADGKSSLKASLSHGSFFDYHGNASSGMCEEPKQSDIDNATMSEIMPHLYLGNELDAKNMDKLERDGIMYILNVTKNIPFYDEQLAPSVRSRFVLKRIAVNDCANQNLKNHYDEAIDFIGTIPLTLSRSLSLSLSLLFTK